MLNSLFWYRVRFVVSGALLIFSHYKVSIGEVGGYFLLRVLALLMLMHAAYWLVTIFMFKKHDPSDLRRGPLATKFSQDTYCRSCKSSVGHNSFMSNICTECGCSGRFNMGIRAYREYFDGKEWKAQRIYNEER